MTLGDVDGRRGKGMAKDNPPSSFTFEEMYLNIFKKTYYDQIRLFNM